MDCGITLNLSYISVISSIGIMLINPKIVEEVRNVGINGIENLALKIIELYTRCEIKAKNWNKKGNNIKNFRGINGIELVKRDDNFKINLYESIKNNVDYELNTLSIPDGYYNIIKYVIDGKHYKILNTTQLRYSNETECKRRNILSAFVINSCLNYEKDITSDLYSFNGPKKADKDPRVGDIIHYIIGVEMSMHNKTKMIVVDINGDEKELQIDDVLCF